MSSLAYLGFTQAQLDALPKAKPGDSVKCPGCGKEHVLTAARGGDGKDDASVLFYECNGDTRLGAIQGRLIVGATPVTAGVA